MGRLHRAVGLLLLLLLLLSTVRARSRHRTAASANPSAAPAAVHVPYRASLKRNSSPDLAAALQGVTRVKLYLAGETVRAGLAVGELVNLAATVGASVVLPSGQALGLAAASAPAVQLECLGRCPGGGRLRTSGPAAPPAALFRCSLVVSARCRLTLHVVHPLNFIPTCCTTCCPLHKQSAQFSECSVLHVLILHVAVCWPA